MYWLLNNFQSLLISKQYGIFEKDFPFYRLVIGFIKGHCEIGLLTVIWNRFQKDYCRVCCVEENLETAGHLLCNCSALSKLTLNSVSRADIKALHRFICSALPLTILPFLLPLSPSLSFKAVVQWVSSTSGYCNRLSSQVHVL